MGRYSFLKLIHSNKKGQLAVEMVLLLALVVGIFVAVSATFRSEQLVARTIATPWTHLAGMIQNGVWGPREDGMTLHPLYSADGFRITTPINEEGIVRE